MTRREAAIARTSDHDASRERVLLATLRALASHGIEGTSVRTIAAEAGVSTGFITHYFTDKGQLMVEALRLSNGRSAERVLGALRGRRGFEALRALIEAILPFDDNRRLEWLLWLTFWPRAGADDPLVDEMRVGRDLWRDAANVLFVQAIEDGEARPDLDTRFEAERLLVVIAGLGLHSQVQTPNRFRRMVRRMVDEHLEGLASRR